MRSPRLWQWRQHQRVVWIGATAPQDEEARAVLAALEEGLRTYGEISRYVADTLFARDCDRVGASADIGIFRSWYLAGARRLLERLDGQLIALEEPPAGDQVHMKAG